MHQQHPPIREEFHSNNTRRRTTATASCSTLGGRNANCHSFLAASLPHAWPSKADVSTNTHLSKKREPHTECRNRTTHNAKVCCLTAHSTKKHMLWVSRVSPWRYTSWILGFLRWILLVLLFSFDICHLRVHPCPSRSIFVFFFLHWTLTCSRSLHHLQHAFFWWSLFCSMVSD